MRHCVKEVDSLFHPKVRWGEDSIFNAPAGVGGKACPAGRVESIHRFHQADGADGNNFLQYSNPLFRFGGMGRALGKWSKSEDLPKLNS